MNGMDVCLINNHLPDFSFMSFIAALVLTASTVQENAGTN